MTRLIAIIGITSFLAAVGLSVYAVVDSNRAETASDFDRPAPELTVTPERFELGTLLQNQVYPATFELTNLSTKPIHIVRVAKSCACSEPTLSTNNLPPGGTATVNVLFKSQMRSGKFDVPLQIHYTLNESPDVLSVRTITLSGTIRPEIEQSAPAFDFKPGISTVVITLSPGSNQLPKINAVSASTNFVRVSLTGPHISCERLDTKADFDGEYVLVETDQPMSRWLRIPIRTSKPTKPDDAKRGVVNSF